MSVRMRHTHAHTRNRRSHHGLTAARLSVCQNCGAKHLRHRACGACGEYRGKEILNVTKAAEKTIKKAEKASKPEKGGKAEKTTDEKAEPSEKKSSEKKSKTEKTKKAAKKS